MCQIIMRPIKTKVLNKKHGDLYAEIVSNAVMEYKIEELTREVRKHNGFAEKIPVIQRDIQVLNHRVSDIETHEHERS